MSRQTFTVLEVLVTLGVPITAGLFAPAPGVNMSALPAIAPKLAPCESVHPVGSVVNVSSNCAFENSAHRKKLLSRSILFIICSLEVTSTRG